MENIDDELDAQNVPFVKTDDLDAAAEYGIDSLPRLVYFENSIPAIYDGDLKNEEKVLEWVLHQVSSDQIEEVSNAMLEKLIQNNRQLAVVFGKYNDIWSTLYISYFILYICILCLL